MKSGDSFARRAPRFGPRPSRARIRSCVDAPAFPYLGALLLGYYDPDGRLIYPGRVGSGIDNAELERLWRRLRCSQSCP